MQYRYYKTIFTDSVRVFPGAKFYDQRQIVTSSRPFDLDEHDYNHPRIPDSAALLLTGMVL